jgi:hypothetical protein
MYLGFRKNYAAGTPFWLSALITAAIAVAGALAVARYWLSRLWRRLSTTEVA